MNESKLSTMEVSFLDRINNLISPDSVILSNINHGKKEEQTKKDVALKEVADLKANISSNDNIIADLNNESKKFNNIFKNSKSEDFKTLNKELNINFDPDEIKNSISQLLPEKIDKYNNYNKDLETKLAASKKNQSDAEDALSEFEVRLSEATSNQKKLIELIDLAKKGSVNVPRNEVIAILNAVGFEDEDARDTAKIIMFPEDGLISFFENISKVSKEPVKEVFANVHSTDVETSTSKEETNPEIAVNSFAADFDKELAAAVEKEINSEKEKTNNDNPFEIDLNAFKLATPDLETSPSVEPSISEEQITPETTEDISKVEATDTETTNNSEEASPDIIKPIFNAVSEDNEEDTPISLKELDEQNKEDTVHEENNGAENIQESNVNINNSPLKDLNLDLSKFDAETLSTLSESNINTIKDNLKTLTEHKIEIDKVYTTPELLIDPELSAKISFFQKIDKTENDIASNPDVLTMYDLTTLDNILSSFGEFGLDPKKVSMLAFKNDIHNYLKNLDQLNEANIELDGMELSKFSATLCLTNPTSLKNNLDILNFYNLSITRHNGKHAIKVLALDSDVLLNNIDTIIETGEEELLKSNPEVLTEDVMGIAERIKFCKEKDLPYKDPKEEGTSYRPYLFDQTKFNETAESDLKLNSLPNLQENNFNSKSIANEDIINDLEEYASSLNYTVIPKLKREDESYFKFSNITNDLAKLGEETTNSYIINNISFSKNKVRRHVIHLINLNKDYNPKEIMLAALIYNSHLSVPQMTEIKSLVNRK